MTITIKDVRPPKKFKNSAKDISMLSSSLAGLLEGLDYELPEQGWLEIDVRS